MFTLGGVYSPGVSTMRGLAVFQLSVRAGFACNGIRLIISTTSSSKQTTNMHAPSHFLITPPTGKRGAVKVKKSPNHCNRGRVALLYNKRPSLSRVEVRLQPRAREPVVSSLLTQRIVCNYPY